MKNLKHFFKISVACGSILAFAAMSGCSGDKQNQDNQTEENTTENVAPDNSEPAPITEAEEMAPQVSETQPAEPQNVEAMNEELASVGLKPRNNPVLKSVSAKYQDWDTNDDQVLENQEFKAGLFDVWDENKDSHIDQSEFERGTKNFFADYNFKEYGGFGDWDTDSNKEVSTDEFSSGIAKITGNENKPMAERLFIVWDQDNDSNIEKIELDNMVVVLNNNDN